jgi:hypothetical protein
MRWGYASDARSNDWRMRRAYVTNTLRPPRSTYKTQRIIHKIFMSSGMTIFRLQYEGDLFEIEFGHIFYLHYCK